MVKSPVPEALIAIHRVEAAAAEEQKLSFSRQADMAMRQSARKPADVKLKTIDEERAADAL